MYTHKKSDDIFIINIDNHQEIVAALAAFCEEQNVHCGVIEGLGAVSSATLRFLDPATKKYVDKTFDEQMEIASLLGNISEKDGKVYLHLHVTLGRRDYSVVGGHLLCARINGACEIFIKPLPGPVGRRFDEETGLNLYKF